MEFYACLQRPRLHFATSSTFKLAHQHQTRWRSRRHLLAARRQICDAANHNSAAALRILLLLLLLFFLCSHLAHPHPTSYVSLFESTATAHSLAALCPFLALADHGTAGFARALCVRGAARRQEDTGGGQGGQLQNEEAQERTIRKRSGSRPQSPRVGSFCFYLVSIELRFAPILVKATAASGETDTPIADTAETGTSCDLRGTTADNHDTCRKHDELLDSKPFDWCTALSPLRGSSPRPYAYEAHALPAELRRLHGGVH